MEEELYTTLKGLVELKKYRDKNGKDEYYLTEKRILWEEANILVRQYENNKGEQ